MAEELTIEQQQAIALARVRRLRQQDAGGGAAVDIDTGIGGPKLKPPAGYQTADYIQGARGFVKNPFRPNAKTTGTVTVRIGDKEQQMTIGDNVPAAAVPAMIQKNVDYQSSALNPENIGNAVANFGRAMNPVPALVRGWQDPIGMGGDILKAQGAELGKARDAFNQGEYGRAIGHGLGYALPVIGPAAANAGEQIRSGDVSGGLGNAAAMVLPEAASMALKNRSIPVVPKMLTKNPAEASAVRFGMREGLPVDAATATGNPAVRGGQWLADNSIGGSIMRHSAKQAEAGQFASKLDELANQPGYTALTPNTPEQAGAAVRGAMESKIAQQHGIANTAYNDLRAIENDPKNIVRIQTGTQPAPPQSLHGMLTGQQPAPVPVYEDIALPVDTTAVKSALAPILEEMKRTMPEAQRQASPGLQALSNIVNGPDFVSASVADRNLSALKGIERGADSKYLRNVSQGLAAKTVSELSDAVDAAVARGGPKATGALQRGRAATKLKYDVAGVLDNVREEPVQAFNQMVYSKDAGINQLRDVATHAPSKMPEVGQAFLNDMFDASTSDGGFERAAANWSKWEKLGPETKKVLFKDPQYIQDLNDFFLLAKKRAGNPNPSGTALVGQTGVMAGAAISHPIAVGTSIMSLATMSKILHSPRAVSLMVDGLKVSGKVPVAAITAANLGGILDSNTKALDVPPTVPRAVKK
jgi:hypothetical protein